MYINSRIPLRKDRPVLTHTTVKVALLLTNSETLLIICRLLNVSVVLFTTHKHLNVIRSIQMGTDTQRKPVQREQKVVLDALRSG
jgi:hypothetical protein